MRRGSNRATRREFLKTAVAASASWAGLARAGRAVPRLSRRKPVLWQAHLVAKIPYGYQVAVADVNGDGRPDILALSSKESIVEWYESPAWRAHPITTRTKGNISLAPLSSHGSRFRGLALATDFVLEDSVHGGKVWWVERSFVESVGEGSYGGPTGGNLQTVRPNSFEEGGWRFSLIGQIPASHRLCWADLEGNGSLRLVDAPILGPGAAPRDYGVGAPLTWYEFPHEIFCCRSLPMSGRVAGLAPLVPHLIDASLTLVHGINVLDWDGDGRDEILTASFEGVHLFHAAGRGPELRWTKVRLAAGDQAGKTVEAGAGKKEIHHGASEIAVGKVAGRWFLATVEPWHGEQVVVYTADEHAQPRKLWDRNVIDDTLRDGHALACADLDGDGDDEIVAGFRGPGTSLYVYSATDPSGTHWERQTLDTEMAASGVAIADLNGDGRLDVVAIGASTGNVKWYENLGTGD